MKTQIYRKADSTKGKKLKKKLKGLLIISIITIVALSAIGLLAGESDEYNQRISILEENHMLKKKVAELETKSATLESRIEELETYISNQPESTEKHEEDESVKYENGLYFYNEETLPQTPDSPRDFTDNKTQ